MYNLHTSLQDFGHESHILVFHKGSDATTVTDVTADNLSLLALKAVRKLRHEYHKKYDRKIVSKYNFYNYSEKNTYFSSKHILKKLAFTPDVIIVHFYTHFLNVKTVYELQQATGANVIFTLMDMALMTGGCHFAWQCKGYEAMCGKCPAIRSHDVKDRTNKTMQFKQQFFSKINPTIVVATEWTRRQAQVSTLFKAQTIEKILLPIDSNTFYPSTDRLSLRQRLGIASGQKVLFFGSQSIFDERKGFLVLSEALKLLYQQLSPDERTQLTVLTAGDKNIEHLIPFQTLHLGVLHGSKALSEAYQAADVFVCPSIEDAGPMMINEAIMCGTPIVSFEMGVSIDLVQTGKTGYRAKLNDAKDFSKGLHTLMFGANNEMLRQNMSENCRAMGLAQLKPSVVAQQWNELLERTNELTVAPNHLSLTH